MTLEERILDAVKRGELTHLALSSNGKHFVATYSAASTYGHNIAEDRDPIKALHAALSAVPKKRQPKINIETEADLDFG